MWIWSILYRIDLTMPARYGIFSAIYSEVVGTAETNRFDHGAGIMVDPNICRKRCNVRVAGDRTATAMLS